MITEPERAVRNAIGRVGEMVTLRRGGMSEVFTASIQPRFTGAKDLSGPAGWGTAMRYELYASAAAPPLRAGDEIEAAGRRYRVTLAAERRFSGGALYRQAELLEQEGE